MSNQAKLLRRLFTTAGSLSKAREIAKRHLPSALFHISDIVPSHAEGAWVYEAETGKKVLDFTTGIGVTNTGHCHPKVVSAIQEQAAKIIHAQQNVFMTSEPVASLCQKMSKIVPQGMDMFLFVNSGSEAVENAIKVARAHTKKQNIIAFSGGYHGRTYGAMAATSSKTVYSSGFGPLMPGVRISGYPVCLTCEGKRVGTDGAAVCCGGGLRELETVLATQSAPDETAAVLIEPILGEGGFYVPPEGYLDGVRKICDKHNILMIMDEVQAGMGRTGHWWAHQALMSGKPDIIVFAKGIASGLPMGGIAASPELFKGCPPASLGGTYGGNPIAAAAACATLDVLSAEDLLQNARDRGAELMAGLSKIAQDYNNLIKDVRGRGLMIGVEFDSVRQSIASAIVAEARKHGLLLMTAGRTQIVRLLPPLVISKQDVKIALDAFRLACESVSKA